jgi:uncharacterized protein YbjT (DUF2867 family)
VVTALVAANYPVTVLVRTRGKLPADLAKAVKEVEIDYDSASSLESALAGIDALVVTVGTDAFGQQNALWLAAEKAGVQRYLPSEFGSDLENPVSAQLPVFGTKIAHEKFLRERVASGATKMTYTLVFNGSFLDWGMEKSFLIDVRSHKAILYDGGDYPFSVTRLSTVGQAVVAVLKHPEETRNRAVRVHDGRVSGKNLLAWVKAVSPTRDWTVEEKSSEETANKSLEALSKGVVDHWVWLGFLYRSAMTQAGGAGFEKTDNELLGMKTLSETELRDLVQELARKIYAGQ